MRLKASLIRYIERSRLAIWLLVIVCLISSFMLVWQRTLSEANESALLLATQRIVERASYYKQQWLLAGQQPQLTIEGQTLDYTEMGWVKPVGSDAQLGCLLWLDVLYPSHDVLGSKPIVVESEMTSNKYHCSYLYVEDRLLSISLINNKFIARVGFLAK